MEIFAIYAYLIDQLQRNLINGTNKIFSFSAKHLFFTLTVAT